MLISVRFVCGCVCVRAFVWSDRLWVCFCGGCVVRAAVELRFCVECFGCMLFDFLLKNVVIWYM